MHLSILKIVLVAGGSALGAALAIFSYSFTVGEGPSDDGPRALVAEFVGLWICFNLLIWSFMVEGVGLAWALRGAGALAAVAGIGLSFYFVNTTEVTEAADKEPTGFKSDVDSIHLE